MTAAQRATLEELRRRTVAAFGLWPRGSFMGERDEAESDALRAALGTCGNCAHADTEHAGDGLCFCAAPLPPGRPIDGPFPFIYKQMPLGERCTGWTAKEGA